MPALLKSTVTLAAVLSAALTGSAMAETGPGMDLDGGRSPGAMLLERFDEIDANGDGQLAPDEIAAHRAAKFAAADANGDGLLDAAEMTALHEAEMAAMLARRAAMMIERHDDTGDGTLSADEMGESPLERRFAVLDTDNDGLVSRAEVEAADTAFAGRGDRRKDGHQGHGMGGHGMGGWMGGWFN